MSLAERIKLNNLPGGARMALLRNPHAPTVSLIAALRGGLAKPDAVSPVVPPMLAAMLERGAGPWGRLNLARELENHGLSLDCILSPSSPRYLFVLTQGLSEELPRMLKILSMVLREPHLEKEELDKLRERMLGILRYERSDPSRRASGSFSRLLYPEGHPHHRREIEERIADLEKLRVEDLEAFHQEVYGLAHMRVAVVGDVGSEETARLLTEGFEGWHEGRIESAPFPPPLDAQNPGEDWVDIPDRPNLDVIMGHASELLRLDEDYIPAQLANACLGQSTLTSRLGVAVRDTAGLTYGINSAFQATADVPGPWQISMGVSAENLSQAVEMTKAVIREYLIEGPGEEELDDERHSWAGSFRVGLATNSGVARHILRQLIAEKPMEELDTLPERILSCSREECIAAMRKHIRPEHLAMAVAGSCGALAAEKN